MRTIAEATPYLEAEIDRLDQLWRRPESAVRRMNDAERAWALSQSIRCTFCELFGREDGDRRWREHMAAAERGRLQ